jgi:prophage regulatory protein
MNRSQFHPPARLIRLPEVSRLTSMSRSAIYRAEAQGTFPKRRRVGLRAVAWSESEVQAWLSSRAEVR